MGDVGEEQIRRSRAIHKQTGRSFYLATRALPERIRESTHILYAFFRICDEVVDDYNYDSDGEEKMEELESLKRQALGKEETDDIVVNAFCEVREECGIPDEEVEVFVDAMKTDISKSRYEDFGELRDYMRGSAAAVGNMMTCVMGVDDYVKAKPHAEALGEAFQMTNFLRDVREDIEKRGRIYLPLETLRRHGAVEDVENLISSQGFRDAVREELLRTEELYREGVEGIRYLPEDCRFPVLLASVTYAEYHDLIRRQDYDVLTEEPSLGKIRMVRLYGKTRFAWARREDSEAVFGDVSAVPGTEPEPERTEERTTAFGRLRSAIPGGSGDD